MRLKTVTIASLAVAAMTALVPGRACAIVPARTMAPTRTFSSGMLRVEQFGRPGRPAVVLMPALFCGSWEWNGQIPLLAATHTVYAVTLPGFDGLPRPRGDHLMDRAAHDLFALISSQRLRHPTLVGHSLGATLAVYFAEHHPGVAGAIIAAEGGYPAAPTQSERDERVAAGVKPYIRLRQVEFGPVLRKNMLQFVITDTSDVDTVEALAARSDPQAMVEWMRAALSLDLTPGLPVISAPFEEIIPFDPRIDPYQGFPSFAAKQAAYDRWVAHAPRGKVVMIDRSRHFMLFDQPAAFDRALLAAIP